MVLSRFYEIEQLRSGHRTCFLHTRFYSFYWQTQFPGYQTRLLYVYSNIEATGQVRSHFLHQTETQQSKLDDKIVTGESLPNSRRQNANICRKSFRVSVVAVGRTLCATF